jgi:hypothetical protein
MAALFILDPSVNTLDNIWTTGGQMLILLGIIANLIYQWKSASRTRQWQLEDKKQVMSKQVETATAVIKKTQEAADNVVVKTKEALDEQTVQIETKMRTRVSDLSTNLDQILKNERNKRRSGDGD